MFTWWPLMSVTITYSISLMRECTLTLPSCVSRLYLRRETGQCWHKWARGGGWRGEGGGGEAGTTEITKCTSDTLSSFCVRKNGRERKSAKSVMILKTNERKERRKSASPFSVRLVSALSFIYRNQQLQEQFYTLTMKRAQEAWWLNKLDERYKRFTDFDL